MAEQRPGRDNESVGDEVRRCLCVSSGAIPRGTTRSGPWRSATDGFPLNAQGRFRDEYHGRPQSCWTDEYLLSHCENYRVVDENGKRLGLVEQVIWSSEPFGEAEALVVRSSERQQLIKIPLRQVSEIKPRSQLLVVAAAVYASSRRSRVAEQ